MPTKRQREGTYIPRFIKCSVEQCTKAATENKLCDGHRVMHQCSKVKDPERWAAIYSKLAELRGYFNTHPQVTRWVNNKRRFDRESDRTFSPAAD